MSYQKAALRLALAVSLFASASAFVLAQDSQDPIHQSPQCEAGT